MNTDSPLFRLAERVGIEAFYWDVKGGYHETTDDTRRKLVAAMGYPADSFVEAEASLVMLDERPWQRMLEPVTVLRTTGEARHRAIEPTVLLVLPENQAEMELRWFVYLEDGQRLDGAARVSDLPVLTHRGSSRRVTLSLPENLPHGYHRVRVNYGASTDEGALIVAPPSAYRPKWTNETNARVWGVVCQLYSLRSPSNWGIGDFSDLATLREKTAGFGGAAVGLPPLHALFPERPELVSPYSPSSRLFLNPLYIDVTAVPEYQDCAAAQAIVGSADFAARIAAARATDAVAFIEVSALKHSILNILFAHFKNVHPPGCGSKRREDFDNFLAEGGERLNRFGLFETLQEHFSALRTDSWPAPYRDPESVETMTFASDHQARIQFHIFLQWEADRQLAAAAKCAESNMDIGLYRDLAVGVTPVGADAWIEPNAFVNGVHIGAPPDPLGPAGQDWGMPPFNPDHLYATAYRPYIDMLRANMRHAGAIRIDHVMWLQRVFWIPSNGDARDGTYVRYPFDDLLAILALESCRNRCVVIGESLGTVTEGFRERLTAEGVLSYRLLHFERHPNGMYKRPETYPALALAAPASHDLPTLAGFWRETDIQVQCEIGLLASEQDAAERRAERAHDRALLIAGLADQQLLSADFPNTPDIGDADMVVFIAAIHCYLARSPAALMMMSLEDILASSAQVNVPGTIDEYPNWRLKLPLDLNRVCGAGGLADVIERIRLERARVGA